MGEFLLNEPDDIIYCFEPVLDTFKLLEKKAGVDSKAVLENIAFGDMPGEKKLNYMKDILH